MSPHFRRFPASLMRPIHVAGPLMLLTGSCVPAGPYTPSTNLGRRAEAVPALQTLVLPSYGWAYAAWRLLPEDPWVRYTKMTLLAALDEAATVGMLPDVRELQIVARAEQAAARVASFGLPRDAMWVVDLRGAASVAFGNALSHAAPHPVSLVLTFNNWPAPRETVPAEETLSALVSLRPRLPDPGSLASLGTLPVFLLDSWRLALRDEDVPDDTVDNRYFLTPADLPDPATLLSRGIQRVIYLVDERGPDPVEEDDLQETFLRYQQAGVQIVMLDLADLTSDQGAVVEGQPLPDVWVGWYTQRLYHVRTRPTLITSPGFYHRARGGFGGLNARPSHVNFGSGFSGPAHGGG